jgi:hypothetical protein
MTDDKDYIINPRTNRKLKVGSMHYKKYIAEQSEAKLKQEAPPPVVEDVGREDLQSHDEPHRLLRSRRGDTDLDNQIIESAKSVLTDLAIKNKKKLTKSIDPETELRKMLYEKLCIAKKKKTKSNSRYKFFVSESDESESSESD